MTGTQQTDTRTLDAASPRFIATFLQRLIAYKPLLYASVSLCWILFHAWPLLLGLLAKAFFDVLEGRAVMLGLPLLVALVLGAGLAKAGVVWATAQTGTPWSAYSNGLLRRNLLEHLLQQPLNKTGSVGETLSTLRDDVPMMVLMTDWLFDAVAGLIFALGGVAILLAVDARVTLLVFLPIVAVIAFAQAARSRLDHTRTASREATARVTGTIGEIFGAVQAVQVAGAEARMVAQLQRQGEVRQQAMLRERLQTLTLDAVFSSTASLGTGLTLLVTAAAMREGTFTVGDFALFATYLLQVAEYTGFLGYLVATLRQSGVSFRRARALLGDASAKRLVEHHPVYLHREPPVPHYPPKGEGDRLERLEVCGLTYLHAETGQGVRDVSFSLERGTLTVLTGRIGSGKTTLLRTLLGLLPAQQGGIFWNGVRVTDLDGFMVPPRVAYTAQVPTLLSGKLRDSILLGLAADDTQVQRALRLAVLEREVAAFPAGLETPIGNRGVRLSGGQLQRTAASRMFVRDAEFFVMDDLSSALDVATEQQLWQGIQNEGLTCLAVSHRESVLERADTVLRLEHGKLFRE